MSEALHVSLRRSQRVFHKMRLKAHGRGHDGKKFREICETVVVNAHGGLLNCRVVFVGEAGSRGQRIGVEFLTPAPHFWGIEFESRQPAPDAGAQTH